MLKILLGFSIAGEIIHTRRPLFFFSPTNPGRLVLRVKLLGKKRNPVQHTHTQTQCWHSHTPVKKIIFIFLSQILPHSPLHTLGRAPPCTWQHLLTDNYILTHTHTRKHTYTQTNRENWWEGSTVSKEKNNKSDTLTGTVMDSNTADIIDVTVRARVCACVWEREGENQSTQQTPIVTTPPCVGIEELQLSAPLRVFTYNHLVISDFGIRHDNEIKVFHWPVSSHL